MSIPNDDYLHRLTDEIAVADPARVQGDDVQSIKSNQMESIQWHRIEDQQPDDGILVLVNTPDASEPVWPGYIEGKQWYWANGGSIEHDVIAWAETPKGLR